LKFVQEEISNMLEIKKSKFITYLTTYNNFNITMKRLKIEHPKGRHFVYAYRYLNNFDQIVENSSDDGEPKGTSGKPALNILNKSDIINSAVIIVRYFGGIKLGTGGLVKAYSDAVNLVCEKTHFILYEKLQLKQLKLPYSMLNNIEYLLFKNNIKIIKRDFIDEIIFTLESTQEKFDTIDTNLPLECKLQND
jgi:uncharacterized YigZ family protein